MPRTSDKSELILEFVSNFIQENCYAPWVREIGAGVGLRSTASVSYHLRALQDKGLLQGGESKGRKRAIATNARAGQIPVVGVVTAGLPILAVENQEGTMAWDGEPGCFALRVRGDSMVGAVSCPATRWWSAPSRPPMTVRSSLPASGTRPPSSACAAETDRSGSCPKTTTTSPSMAPRLSSSAWSRLWCGNTNR